MKGVRDSARYAVALACLGVALSGAAQSTATAHEVVRESVEALFEVVRAAKQYADTDKERFYREVEAVLAPVVDFDGIARSVMAVNYKRATEEQRARFADVFKWGLVRAYAGALLDVGEEDANVLPSERPPRNPRRQSVKMEVVAESGSIYEVIYSMVDLEDKGGWRVRNLIIGGVNLGLNYRTQFADALTKDVAGTGIDGVIDGWAETLVEVNPVVGEDGAVAPAS